MRRFLPIIILLLSTSVFSQKFEVETDYKPYIFSASSYGDVQIDIENLLSDTLLLEWKTIENTLPSGWDLSLCDYTSCYTGIPSNGTMKPVPPGVSGFLKVNIIPSNVIGTGKVRFEVLDTRQTQRDTIEFNITSEVSASLIESKKNGLLFYPNPTSEFLNFKNLTVGNKFVIYSTIGTEMFSFTANESQLKIDVSSLEKGLYFVSNTSIQQTYRFTVR